MRDSNRTLSVLSHRYGGSCMAGSTGFPVIFRVGTLYVWRPQVHVSCTPFLLAGNTWGVEMILPCFFGGLRTA